MISTLVPRPDRAATTAGPTLPMRVEVCPPSSRRPGAVSRFAGWIQRRLSSDSSISTAASGPLTVPLDVLAIASQAPRGHGKLARVQEDFVRELVDIDTREATAVRGAILSARTLRELWHLRSKVFGIVAIHHSQYEAQERLSRLNCHFPTRSPRSGIAPFDAMASLESR